MNREQIKVLKAAVNFRDFIKYIFPLSFPKEIWKEPSHAYEWGDTMQKNKRTIKLAPRGHLKSTITYAYLMWKIAKAQSADERWAYISFKESMAQYHIRNIKQLIERNPYFANLKKLTDAEGLIKYTWDNEHVFEVTPMGVLTFKRGWHGNAICDDILQDPSSQLDPTTIKKITRLFFDEVWFIPNQDQELHVIGTPQHQHDLFFEVRKHGVMHWSRYTAIIDRLNKVVLWPERWSFEDLIDLEKRRPNSFRKEMMCEPVWDVETFLQREAVLECVDPNLKNLNPQATKIYGQTVVGGMDVGKHVHPSHIWIARAEGNRLITIYERWLDNWDYHKQVELMNMLIEEFSVDLFLYDNTRSEFEGFKERMELSPKAEGVVMTAKMKGQLAAKIEEYINTKKLSMPNSQRTINQLLVVNGNLDAYETEEGHGDSFSSLGLMIKAFEDIEGSQVMFRAG